MRQQAPSSSGQISSEAWTAMRDAAQRAGLPLDQWLRGQLFGGTHSAGDPASVDTPGSVADLHQRVQNLASHIERLAAHSRPATPEPVAPAPRTASSADARLDAALRQIDERLDELGTARTRQDEAPARSHELRRPDYRTRSPLSSENFESRLNDIMRDPEPVAAPSTAAFAHTIEAAVAEIAARQNELDHQPSVPSSVSRLASSPSEPPAVAREPAARPEPLNREAFDTLRRDIADMRASLEHLAPRSAVSDLQRAVASLADRVERSGGRDEELRATVQTLREAINSLRLPELGGVLGGRIDTLARKIEILNAKSLDGATLARLQAQSAEIRDLLARSLSTDSVRMLAEQVALLAGKIASLSGSQETLMRSLVSPIEQRLERIESQGASAQAIPVDDIFRRLDAIQLNLANAQRTAPPGMEAMFEGLSERLKRIEGPVAASSSGVSAQQFEDLCHRITALTEKLDQPAASSQQMAGQLSGIERTLSDLFIQIEETRATILATTGSVPRPPAGSGSSPASRTGSSLLRREMAAIEASRTAAVSARAASPVATQQSVAATAEVKASTPAYAAAPVPPAAPAVLAETFEPQMIRAALEQLANAPEDVPPPAASPVHAPLPPEPAVNHMTEEEAELSDTLDRTASHIPSPPAPMNDDSAPARVEFIARARRAAQPSAAVPPSVHHHIGHRQQREKPRRWLERIRAMLLIGICGSALAYGSWHLIGAMKQSQLQAQGSGTFSGGPAASVTRAPQDASRMIAPEDITGSIGNAQPRPAAPPPAAVIAPSSAADAATPGLSSLERPMDPPPGLASPGLRAAAMEGDAGAAYEIGHRFIEGSGATASASRAVEWFNYAARLGSVPALYRLGAIYEKGLAEISRDTARARTLYELAANGGNIRAMHNLAVMLAGGVDGLPDYRAAAEWFSRAAERGLRDSQYNLAVLYARGFGVGVDLSEAWQWFSLAAASGDTEAAVKRDEIARRLDPKSLDLARASIKGWSPAVVDAKANGGSGSDPDIQTMQKTASR